MQKPVLFYSQFCGHSAEAIRTITARDMRSSFALVCIDGIRDRLPAYVDRVPMVFTPDRRLMAEDELFAYISGAGGEPFAAGGGGGTVFSWLGDDENGTSGEGGWHRGASGSMFLALEGSSSDAAWHGQHIDPPPDDENMQQNAQADPGPGRGMMVSSHQQGVPERMMPFGHHGGSSSGGGSLESIEAIRQQELQSWAPPKR